MRKLLRLVWMNHKINILICIYFMEGVRGLSSIYIYYIDNILTPPTLPKKILITFTSNELVNDKSLN